MNIHELIQNNPGINITVTGKELQEFGKAIVDQAKETILQSQDEKKFTAAEFEEMFDICPATRWRWDKEGIINPIRIKSRIYYLESDIKKLLESKSK